MVIIYLTNPDRKMSFSSNLNNYFITFLSLFKFHVLFISMGRKIKYKTKEELRVSINEKSMRYYEKNKKSICEKNLKRYHGQKEKI